jgi:hypothetical protein
VYHISACSDPRYPSLPQTQRKGERERGERGGRAECIGDREPRRAVTPQKRRVFINTSVGRLRGWLSRPARIMAQPTHPRDDRRQASQAGEAKVGRAYAPQARVEEACVWNRPERERARGEERYEYMDDRISLWCKEYIALSCARIYACVSTCVCVCWLTGRDDSAKSLIEFDRILHL